MSNFTKLQNDPLVEAVTEILTEASSAGWRLANIEITPKKTHERDASGKMTYDNLGIARQKDVENEVDVTVVASTGYDTKGVVIGTDHRDEHGKWNFKFITHSMNLDFLTRHLKLVSGYEHKIPANRSHPVTKEQIRSLFA